MSTFESTNGLVFQALTEDSVWDDETSRLVIKDNVRCRAQVIAREAGRFSGRQVVEELCSLRAGEVALVECSRDGDPFAPGQKVVLLEGDLRALLSVERTLLNFLMRLCGVASLTSRFVEAVNPYPTRILATRKTTPGLRSLELQAVLHGGGAVHRRSLSDGILIKENHLQFIDALSAIKMARAGKSPLHGVEIEIQDLGLLDAVLEAEPDVIMLDNLSIQDVKLALEKIKGQCQIEVSGGIRLENVRNYAELGVDFISIGRITHSAPACDLSLELCHAF